MCPALHLIFLSPPHPFIQIFPTQTPTFILIYESPIFFLPLYIKMKVFICTCGFSSMCLTPVTSWLRKVALSVLWNSERRTEAVWTRHDNACKHTKHIIITSNIVALKHQYTRAFQNNIQIYLNLPWVIRMVVKSHTIQRIISVCFHQGMLKKTHKITLNIQILASLI